MSFFQCDCFFILLDISWNVLWLIWVLFTKVDKCFGKQFNLNKLTLVYCLVDGLPSFIFVLSIYATSKSIVLSQSEVFYVFLSSLDPAPIISQSSGTSGRKLNMHSDLHNLQDQKLILHTDLYLILDSHLLLHTYLQEH